MDSFCYHIIKALAGGQKICVACFDMRRLNYLMSEFLNLIPKEIEHKFTRETIVFSNNSSVEFMCVGNKEKLKGKEFNFVVVDELAAE